MGLKHLKLASALVEVSDGEQFTVRGLSLDDISFLVTRHSAKLAALYAQFKLRDDIGEDNMMGLALDLLKQAPELAADMIACASGDHEDSELAAQLPFPVQLDALEKLVTLTFTVAGGPKKVLEIVIRLAQGTTGLLESLKA